MASFVPDKATYPAAKEPPATATVGTSIVGAVEVTVVLTGVLVVVVTGVTGTNGTLIVGTVTAGAVEVTFVLTGVLVVVVTGVMGTTGTVTV